MAKFRDLAHEAKKNWSAQDHALYERAAESFDADARAQIQLGKQIAELREAKHLTQKDLSTITGVQQSEISRIERGLGNPTTVTVSKLARAFDKELSLV